MQHKKGENRDQMFMLSLESSIAPNSFVRVLDAFVDAIDLKSFGFSHVECSEEGHYNLTRGISILGMEKLVKLLRECCLLAFLTKKRQILSHFNELKFLLQIIESKKLPCLNLLKMHLNAFYV